MLRHRWRKGTSLAAGAVTMVMAGLGLACPAWAATGQVSPTPGTAPSFGHVFVIVGENKSLFQLNSSNAPYIMNTLKPESAWFTDYNDVAKGSLADYVALTSGQYAACETHGPCGQQNVPSIFSQLGNGNWMDWNESMPAHCYRSYAGNTTTLNAYKPGHNPALYYVGLPCATYDVPAGTTGPDNMNYFNKALAAGTVPKYNFITPNLCEDSYKSCNGANIITEYSNFLQKEIPLIEASPAFGSDGVIFTTYDEGHVQTADPNTMMAVTGPQVQPGTYSGYYDHYSTVATVEQGLGLPCLANACTASSLPAFGTAAATSCPAVPAGATEYSGNVSVESSQTGWTGHYNSNSAVTRVEPAGGSYDGRWALQVGIKSGSGQGGANNAKPVWVTSTTRGTTYTGSSFVRASVAGEKVSLTLTEKTSGGTKIGRHTTSLTLNDTSWHQVSDSYTAQGTGNVLRYALHAYLASTSRHFLADCLSLQDP